MLTPAGGMLWMFQKAGKKNCNVKNQQFWQQNNKPIELWSLKVFEQKLNYIHNNPVISGFVTNPVDWKYSSARNYVTNDNNLRTFLKFENMKFKLIFIFLLFLVGNVGNSQTKLLQKFVKWRIDEKTKYNILPSYYENQENGRKLFILRMIHINKPEFYQKVKQTIDSLRADGYVVFYEGVRDAKNGNELYERKFRRITHYSLLSYNDEANEVDNKKFGIKGYVYQNDVDYGVNKDTDVNCDLSIKELVDKYEEKFGEVILTDCDTNTPMGKKYKCSKKDKKGTNYMILTLRDRHLVDQIENSKLEKIVVVYGAEHSYAISRKFANSDVWKFVHLGNLIPN